MPFDNEDRSLALTLYQHLYYGGQRRLWTRIRSRMPNGEIDLLAEIIRVLGLDLMASIRGLVNADRWDLVEDLIHKSLPTDDGL